MNKPTRFALAVLALAPAAGFAQTLAPSQDTYFVPNNGTNFGTGTTVTVGASSSVGLVQFDLTQLPAGLTAAQIQKATLTLFLDHVTSAGTINIDAVSAATPWSELAVTGNSGVSPGGAIATSTPVANVDTFISVDATAAVQGWITTPASNNGFLLAANPSTSVQFDSKENTTTSHPAMLTIILASTGEPGPRGATGAQGPTGPAGGGSVSSVGSGMGLIGGTITTAGTLSIDPTIVPQLGTANTFSQNQTINASLGIGTGSPAALLDVEAASVPLGPNTGAVNAAPVLRIAGGRGQTVAGGSGGSGSSVSLSTGGGGSSLGAGGGGGGGSVTITTGSGGSAINNFAGAGGGFSVTTGNGGANDFIDNGAGGQGGSITLQPGSGGSGGGTAGNVLLAPNGTGLVGIGTAAPAFPLDVNGGARFSGAIQFAPSQTFPLANGGVTNTMLANNSITVNAGSGLSGGGTVALGGSTTLNATFTQASADNRYLLQSGGYLSGSVTYLPGAVSNFWSASNNEAIPAGFVGAGAPYGSVALINTWTSGSIVGEGSVRIGVNGNSSIDFWTDGNAGVAANNAPQMRLRNDQLSVDYLTLAEDLTVNSVYASGNVYAGNQCLGSCYSDLRLKKNIQPFAQVLSKLTQLQPVTYDYRTEEHPELHLPKGRSTGLIAQEVEKVFPEMVSRDANGFRQVNYGELPYLMLQAIKELKTDNDALREQVDQLKTDQAEIRKLRAEMEQLKAAAQN